MCWTKAVAQMDEFTSEYLRGYERQEGRKREIDIEIEA